MAAGDRALGIEIPKEQNATATYPIATLKAAPNPIAATAFAEFVNSPTGRKILQAAGFGAP